MAFFYGENTMKTIGLIGGMSWESTQLYYQQINQGIRDELGGLHSAQAAMYSIDFARVEQLQAQGEWFQAGLYLADVAKKVEAASAECIVLCTNTMHKVAGMIEESVQIPLLHIADATAEVIQAASIQKIGLLGTKFTMEDDFYQGRLQDKFGLEVVVPSTEEREHIHRIIYQELCLGEVKPESKRIYQEIMQNLVHNGAEGIILGCTEITLLVGAEDTNVPVFDTTAIHAQQAVKWSLS